MQRARASVLKIRGRAPSCSRALEGSGFVIGNERVMTNAHVVAGTSEVSVEVPQSGGGSQTESARVVYYDEQVDIAVLAVPGLEARTLPFNFSGSPDRGQRRRARLSARRPVLVERPPRSASGSSCAGPTSTSPRP